MPGGRRRPACAVRRGRGRRVEPGRAAPDVPALAARPSRSAARRRIPRGSRSATCYRGPVTVPPLGRRMSSPRRPAAEDTDRPDAGWEYLDRAGRSVCYVAPTPSLCREVRRAMTGRVHVLQKETNPTRPNSRPRPNCRHPLPRPAGRCRGADPGAAAHLLRHDAGRAGAVRHVHLRRGPAPEGDRARVHPGIRDRAAGLPQLRDRSRDRADLGRDGQRRRDREWLSPDGQALRHESQWRGPLAAGRRLHHWS